MRVICEGRPEDVVFRCETEEDKKKIKDTPFVLKEGCNYKITLSFRVQHEIVTGLKYVNTVYRKGIKGNFNSFKSFDSNNSKWIRENS
jgi:Rho GDP-dissociation inhibitor